jgi:hypothetical protein
MPDKVACIRIIHDSGEARTTVSLLGRVTWATKEVLRQIAERK